MSKKKSQWSSSESDSEKSSIISRSQSLTSKSTRKSKDKQNSNRYSDNFSSEFSDTDIKSKKTKTPTFSDTESFSSSLSSPKSAGSESNLKNLIEEYEPNDQLPEAVHQVLETFKKSLINIYNLKKTFKENLSNIKQCTSQSHELAAINEKIADLMVHECLGCITLSQVVYGSSHWKYAMTYTELALIYLEFKNLPKQAKQHCETAWKILYEELKNKTLHEANKSEYQSNNFESITPLVIDKHQMMLNYIYGRACTLLKENESGQSILESAKEYFDNWTNNLAELKLKLKNKEEISSWKLKINFCLAKQYAINKSNSNAIEYYDKCIDLFKSRQTDLDIIFEIYYDKAKIESNKENFAKSIDVMKECLEKFESLGSEFYVCECKLAMARIYAELDDMTSVDKAEDLYNQTLEGYSKLFSSLNEKIIMAKNDMIKFYLKQEKYDTAFKLLEELLKNKIELYGDFSPKLVTSYKLLCSILLKKNDLANAIRHLNKSLEIEALNYGKTSKQYQKTSETLDNLQTKINTKSEKPSFNPSRKVNHYKEDLALYAPKN